MGGPGSGPRPGGGRSVKPGKSGPKSTPKLSEMDQARLDDIKDAIAKHKSAGAEAIEVSYPEAHPRIPGMGRMRTINPRFEDIKIEGKTLRAVDQDVKIKIPLGRVESVGGVGIRMRENMRTIASNKKRGFPVKAGLVGFAGRK